MPLWDERSYIPAQLPSPRKLQAPPQAGPASTLMGLGSSGRIQ